MDWIRNAADLTGKNNNERSCKIYLPRLVLFVNKKVSCLSALRIRPGTDFQRNPTPFLLSPVGFCGTFCLVITHRIAALNGFPPAFVCLLSCLPFTAGDSRDIYIYIYIFPLSFFPPNQTKTQVLLFFGRHVCSLVLSLRRTLGQYRWFPARDRTPDLSLPARASNLSPTSPLLPGSRIELQRKPHLQRAEACWRPSATCRESLTHIGLPCWEFCAFPSFVCVNK